jgi:tRNA pseudouridine55 synthase
LDPNATGLLIIVLGRGTKLSEKLMSDDKVYQGSIKMGEATGSYDADSELVASLPVPPLSLDDLNATATEFVGDQMQTPPMVSAVKKDGVPLYKLARKGIEVAREPRLIHIYRFRFSSYVEPIGVFEIACTKGTYVRSVAHELGQKIGCGAHLATLRRVRSGKFDVEGAIQFEDLMRISSRELEKLIIPFLKLSGT